MRTHNIILALPGKMLVFFLGKRKFVMLKNRKVISIEKAFKVKKALKLLKAFCDSKKGRGGEEKKGPAVMQCQSVIKLFIASNDVNFFTNFRFSSDFIGFEWKIFFRRKANSKSLIKALRPKHLCINFKKLKIEFSVKR